MLKDKNQYSILVIEDNSGDFLLIEDYLDERMKHPGIQHVKYFKEAKALLETANHFNVILLDLSLTDKTGEALIKEVIFLAGDIPVIILTGYSDVDFSIKSLSLGVADYLLKDDITANALYKSIIYNIERKKINLQLKESEQRLLEQKIQENKNILKEVIGAQERERSEIGKELHDNVNQILAASNLYLNHCLTQENDYKTFVKKSQQYIADAIEEIRKLTKALVGPSTEKFIGLIPTIKDLVNDLSVVKDANILFCHSSFKEEESGEEMKLVIFRIIQEQLNNIFKYADASEIKIQLVSDDQHVGLMISDNGKGFDTTIKSNGIGLTNIKNRAAVHNGTVKIISSPGNGCMLNVSLYQNSNN